MLERIAESYRAEAPYRFVYRTYKEDLEELAEEYDRVGLTDTIEDPVDGRRLRRAHEGETILTPDGRSFTQSLNLQTVGPESQKYHVSIRTDSTTATVRPGAKPQARVGAEEEATYEQAAAF